MVKVYNKSESHAIAAQNKSQQGHALVADRARGAWRIQENSLYLAAISYIPLLASSRNVTLSAQ